MQQHPVKQQHLHKVHRRERDPADGGDAPLLPHNAERVLRLRIAEGQAAYDRGGRLRAGVAAGAHQHGDEGDKPRLHSEHILKLCEYHARKGRRQHQEHQPRDAVFPHLKRAGSGIRLVGRRHTGHDFKVFRRLFFHDVDDVVNGDDADESALEIDHRYRHKVVVGYLFRNALLIFGGRGKDDVCVHQVLDDRVILGKQQILHGHDAFKLPVGRGDEADVYRLLVLADTADARDGLAHAHIFFQVNEFRGHYAARGILRIMQILIYELSRLRRRGAHDALYDVCGKLLHHVDGVVNVQLFQYSGELRVRDGVYHLLLLGSVKICENLRRRLL